ncbi:hypothetical protein [Methylovulum sp.]|uniref:hypothetical protein n=1 Tax=Methylovulum sp. TaxID=1916980 RepID=UPI0026302B32|nr:hypothetical protein [Methylovulum sp.]MDD5123601.1 hypothetical protein [Methylovulum sp.]
MQAYKQLLLQWRENPRLRIGLILITLIVVGNGLLALDEYQNGLLEEYTRQDKKLTKLHYVQRQTDWAEKADSIKNIRLQLENGLWRAETKGLAQANAQTWFSDKIRQLNLNGLEIAGASVQSDLKTPAIWRVALEIKGTLYDTDLLELLNNIEQNPQLMQIEQLQINRDLQDLLRITLQVSCYFQASDKQ